MQKKHSSTQMFTTRENQDILDKVHKGNGCYTTIGVNIVTACMWLFLVSFICFVVGIGLEQMQMFGCMAVILCMVIAFYFIYVSLVYFRLSTYGLHKKQKVYLIDYKHWQIVETEVLAVHRGDKHYADVVLLCGGNGKTNDVYVTLKDVYITRTEVSTWLQIYKDIEEQAIQIYTDTLTAEMQEYRWTVYYGGGLDRYTPHFVYADVEENKRRAYCFFKSFREHIKSQTAIEERDAELRTWLRTQC